MVVSEMGETLSPKVAPPEERAREERRVGAQRRSDRVEQGHADQEGTQAGAGGGAEEAPPSGTRPRHIRRPIRRRSWRPRPAHPPSRWSGAATARTPASIQARTMTMTRRRLMPSTTASAYASLSRASKDAQREGPEENGPEPRLVRCARESQPAHARQEEQEWRHGARRRPRGSAGARGEEKGAVVEARGVRDHRRGGRRRLETVGAEGSTVRNARRARQGATTRKRNGAT